MAGECTGEDGAYVTGDVGAYAEEGGEYLQEGDAGGVE